MQLKNQIKLNEVKLKLSDIKNLYEYFYEQNKKDGINQYWSWIVYNNLELLDTPYKQIRDGIYDEKRDPKYQEYGKKMAKIIMQYVDRDEQCNPIYDEDGQPRITNEIVEYNKECEKIEKEYAELLRKLDQKESMNVKFISQKVTIKLYQMEIDSTPKTIPPVVVKFCSYDEEKETE